MDQVAELVDFMNQESGRRWRRNEFGEWRRVTLVLDHIGLSVGDMPVITDVSLSFEKGGTMNVLLDPTLCRARPP